MKNSSKNTRGFTLIELLVVVIIIGVLSAIAIPGYMRSVEKTKASIAMQALSDIAKAEHDYYATQSRYTNDFGDLTITITDANTMGDADNSSYSTKHFVYNLHNNLDAATASRTGGDAPYTLYRLFDDPRIYCQPKGNKYCEMLDLPAGTFTHSIGSWQSCEGGVYPCSKSCARNTASGFSCYGTYNEDGSFSEKVCNSGTASCITTQYNEENQIVAKNSCYGIGGVWNDCKVITYDDEGRVSSSRTCCAQDENGLCTSFCGGNNHYNFTYNPDGSVTATRVQCNANGSGCTEFCNYGYCSTNYYNEQGKISKEIYPHSSINYEYNEDGYTRILCSSDINCNSGTGDIKRYNNKGELISETDCSQYTNGSCSEFGSERRYEYNDNGTLKNESSCFNNSCNYYQYDAVGNIIHEEYSDGRTYNYNYDYTYDSSGKIKTACNLSWNYCYEYSYDNGKIQTRTNYDDGPTRMVEYYTYDEHGNSMGTYMREYWKDKMGGGREAGTYIYDDNGNLFFTAP